MMFLVDSYLIILKSYKAGSVVHPNNADNELESHKVTNIRRELYSNAMDFESSIQYIQ
jgi:hypothetical protein